MNRNDNGIGEREHGATSAPMLMQRKTGRKNENKINKWIVTVAVERTRVEKRLFEWKTPFKIILKILVMIFERDVEEFIRPMVLVWEKNVPFNGENYIRSFSVVPLANIETILPSNESNCNHFECSNSRREIRLNGVFSENRFISNLHCMHIGFVISVCNSIFLLFTILFCLLYSVDLPSRIVTGRRINSIWCEGKKTALFFCLRMFGTNYSLMVAILTYKKCEWRVNHVWYIE